MNAKQGQRLGIILVLAGFAVGIPGFWLLIAHDHFEATARIQIEREQPPAPDTEIRKDSLNSDPYYIPNPLEVIRSENVLGRVINALHLDAEWGNRFAEGRKLNPIETLNLLRQCMRLRTVQNTLLVDVGVISEDPVEAAKIANAIAQACCDYQLEDQIKRSLPQSSSVAIIARAEPPTSPIAPNRTLGKVLLGVGVLLLVCGFVTFVRNWRRPDEAVG